MILGKGVGYYVFDIDIGFSVFDTYHKPFVLKLHKNVSFSQDRNFSK